MLLARRGLSLVELLIVVTLIVIMMALSLPMLTTANAKARSELCQQNMFEIAQTVSLFTEEMGCMPTLHALEPTKPGLSLPEFVEPRLQSPYALFCPSDETERSLILGTSYQWSRAFNGLRLGQLNSMIEQPLLTDREAFHINAPLPINEMLLRKDNQGYRLGLLGEDPRDERANRPDLYLGKKRGKPGDDDDDDDDDDNDDDDDEQGPNGQAHGWYRNNP